MLVEEAYVPTVIDELKSLKNAREIEVTVIEPCCFQVYKASYSCSAAANVLRYHGFPP